MQEANELLDLARLLEHKKSEEKLSAVSIQRTIIK